MAMGVLGDAVGRPIHDVDNDENDVDCQETTVYLFVAASGRPKADR